MRISWQIKRKMLMLTNIFSFKPILETYKQQLNKQLLRI